MNIQNSKKLQGIKVVLFDLDGTLLNSLPGIKASFEHLFNHHTPPHLRPPENILSWVGRPLETVMLELSRQDETLAETLIKEYRRHNRQLIPTFKLFPKVEYLLNQLSESPYRLGIVTSKNRQSTMLSIKALQLDQIFDVIVTKDDTSQHKPNPGPLLFAMEKMGSHPEETVYVGDAVFDIKAAKAAKCLDIGALWGAHDKKSLLEANPTITIENVLDILSLLPTKQA